MNLYSNYICVLFLCIILNETDTLLCITENISRFDLRRFNLDSFQETIHSLHTEEYGYGTMCKIQFFKIYNQLAIKFGSDTQLSVPLKNGDIYLNTKVSLDRNIFKIFILSKVFC